MPDLHLGTFAAGSRKEVRLYKRAELGKPPMIHLRTFRERGGREMADAGQCTAIPESQLAAFVRFLIEKCPPENGWH